MTADRDLGSETIARQLKYFKLRYPNHWCSSGHSNTTVELLPLLLTCTSAVHRTTLAPLVSRSADKFLSTWGHIRSWRAEILVNIAWVLSN